MKLKAVLELVAFLVFLTDSQSFAISSLTPLSFKNDMALKRGGLGVCSLSSVMLLFMLLLLLMA